MSGPRSVPVIARRSGLNSAAPLRPDASFTCTVHSPQVASDHGGTKVGMAVHWPDGIAAKGGQRGWTRSMATELASFGITVNMISPGWIPVVVEALDHDRRTRRL